MKLSILICSVFGRHNELNRQLELLNQQIRSLGERNKEVQVLIFIDDLDQTIGDKRNYLLNMAQGDYIVFIDDDDEIGEGYISEILKALESGPDCAGIKGVITYDGANPERFIHSIQYDSWGKKDGIFFRTPNHWNPVKRELALKAGFPSSNYGEDHEYSKRLRPFLQTEVMIEKEPIYHYLFDPKDSLACKRLREDKEAGIR